MKKVIFILEKDHNETHEGLSSTLYYASTFVHEMLRNSGLDSDLKIFANTDTINSLIAIHRPDYVIIDPIWINPLLLSYLCNMHPNIKWIGRIHCEIQFLASIHNSIKQIADYSNFKNVILGLNSPRAMREISIYLKLKNKWTVNEVKDKVIYLPNFYPQIYNTKKINKNKEHIDIGCFGAIRLLKNHVIQIISAVEFADQIGKKLRFHVNASRIEMENDNIAINIKTLFEQLHNAGHEMINHEWQPREEFLKLCNEMDIGMQVSISETFNIVAADLISQGVPIVGSIGEIPWAIPEFSASYSDSKDITKKLHLAYNRPLENVQAHQASLKSYTDETIKIWKEYFGKN